MAADEINEMMTDSKINGVTCGGIVVAVVAVVVVFVDVAANIALVVGAVAVVAVAPAVVIVVIAAVIDNFNVVFVQDVIVVVFCLCPAPS